MSATIIIPFLPTGLSSLIAKFTAVGDAPAADPAGYSAIDIAGDGRYRVIVPPYSGNQPAGHYWCRLFRPGKSQPALAFFIDLVDGETAEANDVSAVAAAVKDVHDLLAADEYIDDTVSPWEVVYLRRGTNQEIARQQLRGLDNQPITSIAQFVASKLTSSTTTAPP